MTLNKDEEIKQYFEILCRGDYPQFIDKYIKTPELQRLEGVGQFCGIDYNKIPLLNTKYWYSRLDHSIACACITWSLTKDKSQTIAALFHDIGTPAFSHSVDYMLDDFEKQESSEKTIEEVICDSKEINKLLLYDEIDISNIFNIEQYTIVENEKPKICVDRLEGILHTGLIWRQFWNLEDIKKIYNSVIVGINEDHEEEITFDNIEIAEIFMQGIYEYGICLQSSEDKLSLYFMGAILATAIKNNILEKEQLYINSEQEIIGFIEGSKNNNLKDMWKAFTGLEEVKKTEHFIEDKYCISVESKKRFAIPLVKVGDTYKRLVKVSENSKKLVENYLAYKDSKFVSHDSVYKL